MRARMWLLTLQVAVVAAAAAALVSCSSPANNPETVAAAAGPALEIGGQDEFGPYEPVANWPQPLPDGSDGVKHEGWTWGSVGAIWAETPDRIWIAQRGELPLPAGAKPWTPYALLNPSRGNATGNGDGLSATCEAVAKRGWERRWHHSVFVVDRDGKMVQEWPHLEKLWAAGPCGRGPHKIKMNPYDPEKHVWIIDDQLHVIYKFTHDGKLVQTLGTVGQRGRDGGKLFDRPTDVDWLPDGTFFISDGYGGTRVAKFDRDGKFLMDWGGPPKDRNNPQAERVQHGAQHRHQQGPPALRRGSHAPAVPGLRRERQVPHDVHDRRELVTVLSLHLDRPVPVGWRRWNEQDPQVTISTAISCMAGAAAANSAGCSAVRTRSRPTRTAICTWPKCSTAACRSSARSRTPTGPGSSARRLGIPESPRTSGDSASFTLLGSLFSVRVQVRGSVSVRGSQFGVLGSGSRERRNVNPELRTQTPIPTEPQNSEPSRPNPELRTEQTEPRTPNRAGRTENRTENAELRTAN